jgi:hypothetical protein
LGISPSKTFIQNAQGTPFLLHGDSPWSAEVQLTTAQIDTYLNDRASRGFTAVLFEAMEHLFSSQSPAWKNANGDVPFTTMSPVSWTSRVGAYWSQVDYLVNAAKSRGIACLITPAYAGFSGGNQGWTSDIDAAVSADLQNYGAFLANRYTQGNVIWVMGGDYAGTNTQRDKQWNIAIGILSVNVNALFCAHPARSDSDGYTYWGPGGQNYSGWNINTIYTDNGGIVSEAATAYGRTGPYPIIQIETYYEGEFSMTTNGLAQECLQSYLSGCCGYMFGNNPIWGFGEPNFNGGAGAASALATSLNTAGAQTMDYIQRLMRSYSWQLLVPKTDASLVSSALGSGVSATCPALSSDTKFALIHKNDGASTTVVMSAFSKTPLRARWYDPTAGTYTNPAEGTSFPNTGSQAFAHPGNNSVGSTCWVLVVD